MIPLHINDKYEVIEQIGRGGMGIVYRARHRALQTMLAVKVLPPELAGNIELVNRFHQEARLMAQLKHPNIVQVVDVDKVGDIHYFIMEYIAGKSLSQHLREQRRLSLLDTLGIARQIVSALEYAHKHEPPVIHRDIKPDNILIESFSGRVVVTDFGIAKVLGAIGYTTTDMVMGTLLYCAPEQVLRPEELDGRADLYSLGMVMYELISGHPFFAGLDERALLGRALYGPEENLPTFSDSTPPEFVSLVTKAIARDPAQRYQTATNLRQAIEHCLTQHAPTAPTAYLTVSPTEAPVQTIGSASPLIQGRTNPWLHVIRSPRVHVFLLLCLVLSTAFFLTRHFLPVEAQPPPALTQNVPSPLFAPQMESVAAGEEEMAATIKPVEEVLFDEKQESKTPLVPYTSEQIMFSQEQMQPPSLNPADETVGARNAEITLGEVETEDPEILPLPQQIFPPRRYRVTTKTVVRDRPTWKGEEIARLKPNTKIYVVALTGDWLKVESRSRPPKPPGYVWKKDAKPE